MTLNPKWYLTIFYREVGKPQVVRVGRSHLTFGRGIEHLGKLAIAQIEVTEEDGSIEVFPGSVILAIVCAPQPGIDERFKATLSPYDEAELVRPAEVINLDPKSLKQITGPKSFLDKQLDGRKRIVG